jgi:hypothetical protein
MPPLGLIAVLSGAFSHRPTLPTGAFTRGLAVPVRVPVARPWAAQRGSRAGFCMGVLDQFTGSPRDDDDESPRLPERGELARPNRKNKFYDTIVNISAPELVQNFARTAPPEVQLAIKTTVMSLFGSMSGGQIETSITGTTQNVASLMYSMQMTGYMLRNAEYRRSLKQSIARTSSMLPGDRPMAAPKISGKIAINLGGQAIEVDAAAYVADLHKEVEELKAALARVESDAQAKEAGGSSSLLAYMQSLPREGMQALSQGITPEVMECMQILIEAVLARDTGVANAAAIVDSKGVKLRELLVWQLVTGYTLRELEQKEELNKLFAK